MPTGRGTGAGTGLRARSRWTGRRAVELHLALITGVTISTVGTWVEVHRALDGHQLGWAYAVEWPLIGAFCGHLWWRLLGEPHTGPPAADATRAGTPGPGVPADDPGLLAWRAYLADLHATDPPGGPPR